MELEDYSRQKHRTLLQYHELDKALQYLSSAYDTNLQAQEIYLDILKKNRKNIDSRYIKLLYRMFSENKACEICFEKQSDAIQDFDERMLGRYYSRIIEYGIKKISYFWINSKKLEFLFPAMVRFVKQIYKIVHTIQDIKTLDQHKDILRMLFAQTNVIQQQIFNLLIDEGYLSSMDQFYRINGVDMITQQIFDRKVQLQPEIIEEQAEEQVSSLQNLSYRKITQKTLGSKNKIQTKKLVFRETTLMEQVTDEQIKDGKNSIINMFKTIINTLKNISDDQKSPRKVVHRQVKKPYKKISVKKSKKDQQISPNNTNVNFNSSETRKMPKKLSIDLINYFSSQFKNLVDQAEHPDINCLSELIVTSQSNKSRKKVKQISLTQSNDPKIHSSQSLNLLRDHRKKSRLFDKIANKNYNDDITDSWDSYSAYEKFRKKSGVKQKFSFKSAPGMYISVKKGINQLIRGQQLRRNNFNVKTFLTQHNQHKKLFENQVMSKDYFEKTIAYNQSNNKNVKVLQNNGFGFGIDLNFLKTKIERQNNFRIKTFEGSTIIHKSSILSSKPLNQNMKMPRSLSNKLSEQDSNHIQKCDNKPSKQFNVQKINNEKLNLKITDSKQNIKSRQQPLKSINKQTLKSNNKTIFTIFDRTRRKILYKS